jgi:hypothetical protein
MPAPLFACDPLEMHGIDALGAVRRNPQLRDQSNATVHQVSGLRRCVRLVKRWEATYLGVMSWPFRRTGGADAPCHDGLAAALTTG